MERESPLDDPDSRSAALAVVTRGGTLDQAAGAIGTSKRTLIRHLKRPEWAAFKLELDAARSRAEKVAHHAPRMLPAKAPASPSSSPRTGLELTDEDRREFIETLNRHAQDPQSRGCAKALDILAQLHFARDLALLRAEIKRAAADDDAGDRRPVVIRGPRPRPERPPGVIDVEADSTFDA